MPTAHLLTVCYLDLDHFKPVNDRFGHAAGDRLLVELAGRLRSALRSSDHLVRYRGAAGRRRVRAAAARHHDGRSRGWRWSGCCASLPSPTSSTRRPSRCRSRPAWALRLPDRPQRCRHPAAPRRPCDVRRQAGRPQRLPVLRPRAPPPHRRARAWPSAGCRKRWTAASSCCTTSPRWTCAAASCSGFEALLRWDHPQQGLLAPPQFLPLIENTGLSSRVGDWVLAQALEHLAQWRRDGLDISVSVNVSAAPPAGARLRAAADRAAGAPPRAAGRLARTRDAGDRRPCRHRGHLGAAGASAAALGVRFALDDFGTGYSTLTYLKQLPVDMLKIDRSFVHHMLDDAQDRAIVEGVIGLARTFRCVVVAEGVGVAGAGAHAARHGLQHRPGHRHRRADAGERGGGLGARLQRACSPWLRRPKRCWRAPAPPLESAITDETVGRLVRLRR